MIAQVSRERAWSQVIAQAWADEDFKARLLMDPRGVLTEYGIDVPDGVELRLLEDTDTVRHLILPPPPSEELTDEDLSGSAVADSYSGFSGGCGRCGCGCGGCGRCRCD
jgi:hypothetical protein